MTDEKDALVDAFAIAVIALVSLVGLKSVYDGIGVMIVGSVGIAAGIVLGWLVRRAGLSALSTLGLFSVVYVVASGPALPDDSIAGILPGPQTPSALLNGLIHSWPDLVTTAPPAGLGAGLGVVPYTCGFVGAGLAMLLARKTARPLLPALPLLLVLMASFVLGTVEPFSTMIQGGLFALMALGWAAVRANRSRRSTDGTI
ncbi:MAG: hypothetical protein ABI470_05265, partial [Aquihabitans sp.]